MKDFVQLKRNLKGDFSSKKTLKVAILGDFATQLYCIALRGSGYEAGFDFCLFESDFNQIDYNIHNPHSDLYSFQPDVIVLFHSTQKLLSVYNKLTSDPERSRFAESHINSLKKMIETIQLHLSASIIYPNFPEIDDTVFGSFSNKTESSFLFQLRKLNFELMSLSLEIPPLFIADISSEQNRIGRDRFFQPSIYINTEMVLSMEALPLVAKRTTDIISALQGKSVKCIILDLDNTLWGGIIGDDGLENIQIGNLGIGKAFTEFQYWLKKMKERGIILAVCSKNTESVAKEPFEKHPDMILKLEDIAVFVANWENKADNIRFIQSVLNIGFDSMVFLDDNPFERNLVRENIPDITVPELPEDPADYLEFLYSQNLFETISYTNADADRTRQYQVEAERAELKKTFTDEAEFLQAMQMEAEILSFSDYTIPRIAQLIQRSNQFNLRTIRYSENDIHRLKNDPDYFLLAFTLKDKYGDHGLISVVILKKENTNTLFIDTWVMSCRVLKRGMEDFILNTMANLARANSFSLLKGEYIPTPKNGLVKNLFQELGFEKKEEFFFGDVTSFQNRECFISRK